MEAMRETDRSQTMISVDEHNSLGKIVIKHLTNLTKNLLLFLQKITMG